MRETPGGSPQIETGGGTVEEPVRITEQEVCAESQVTASITVLKAETPARWCVQEVACRSFARKRGPEHATM